jgi:hypothetical protein
MGFTMTFRSLVYLELLADGELKPVAEFIDP